MKSYRYSKNWRLGEGAPYSHSPYRGESFLSSYLADRSAVLDELRLSTDEKARTTTFQELTLPKVLERIEVASDVTPNRELMALQIAQLVTLNLNPDCKSNLKSTSGSADIQELLDDFIYEACQAMESGEISEKKFGQLRIIARIFEVKKELYSSVSTARKIDSSVATAKSTYPKFATALGLALLLKPDLQLLSTFLKLNDRLIFELRSGKALAPESLVFPIVAEMFEVVSLARVHGINLVWL